MASRRSAVALVVVGLFVSGALFFGSKAGARLPHAAPTPTPQAKLVNASLIVNTSSTPAIAAAKASPNHSVRHIAVKKGETLMTVLRRAGVAPAQAQRAVTAAAQKWNPRDLRIGQEIGLRFDRQGLSELRLKPDPLHDLVIARRGDRYDTALRPRGIRRVAAKISGTIKTSLGAAAEAAGVPHAAYEEFLDAFRGQIDFARDLQPGDRFEIMFNRLIDAKNGNELGVGKVTYAALNLNGRELRLFRFRPPGGEAHFYTAAGTTVKKALLRKPIHDARLTSPFGMRVDPVLHIRALHTGIDLAAPTGTPIYAAGDGVVVRVGRETGYGKLIVLRHEDGFSTAYAHLSRYARGMRPGLHVNQGEVIGYVGNTGYSTGPHLLYEIRVDNRPVNPQTVRLPPAQKLKGKALVAFKVQKAQVEQRLAMLPNISLLADN